MAVTASLLSIRLVHFFCLFFISLNLIVALAASKTHYGIATGSDAYVASALVRQGFIPCSPIRIKVAITICLLEQYRLLFLRCPRLSIQPFVKALCDMHGLPFRPYLSQQFSIAFDLYLDIKAHVCQRVAVTLNRDKAHWRLANACPCCQYKVEHEEPLEFGMLFSMDGNDSLKRMHRRERLQSETGEHQFGESKERWDPREGGSDYFLSREEVDKHDAAQTDNSTNEEPKKSPAPSCDQWHNTQDSKTKPMWGIYDESGIFLSVCRHGFVLLILDMVKSGELRKYPLAVVKFLLSFLPEDLGGGYDIGCSFETTLANSPLTEEARKKGYQSLVGLFHGYAHNRLCQLRKLGTYKSGMGLEDLETCERWFANSNNLASAVRHCSIFHRRQSIAEYARHYDNFHTYPALSKFICDNYAQAAEILTSVSALKRSMREMKISSEPGVFKSWLEQERIYLESRVVGEVPEPELLRMEYLKTLEKFYQVGDLLAQARREWLISTPETVQEGQRDKTSSIETARRQQQERHSSLLLEIQALETKLQIMPQNRWTPRAEEWKETWKKVQMEKYQKALDQLEGLIVLRMFELMKLNMSQTGYKLRKHIGQSLKAQSQAIRTALERYNDAASKLSPPRPSLSWEIVVEYAFLSEFELLRDARQDIRSEPWATPAGRTLLDKHFKILRAQEEIKRCNVEIVRLISYMEDEEKFLVKRESEIRGTDAGLAHQIFLHRMERGRANATHLRRFQALSKKAWFTGSLEPQKRLPENVQLNDMREMGGTTANGGCRSS
ncbi:hypothetical protein C8J56DRAFT_772406 [Mycena floridula]|nr:hypothetical protein C8J56DRAFT_772406 [Mycena floridula]